MLRVTRVGGGTPVLIDCARFLQSTEQRDLTQARPVLEAELTTWSSSFVFYVERTIEVVCYLLTRGI